MLVGFLQHGEMDVSSVGYSLKTLCLQYIVLALNSNAAS